MIRLNVLHFAPTLLLFCFFSVANASNDTAMLTAELQKFTTLNGKFQQTLSDEEGMELQQTSGIFKVKRPGYFYWQTEPPFEQLVVGTPEVLQVYDPDLEQLTIYKKDSFAGTPALLLSGDESAIATNYQVTHSTTTAGEQFLLKHKDPENNSFDTLTFIFDKKGIRELLLLDKLGQLTKVIFDDVQTNISLGKDAFEFTPPPDVDVIVDGQF